LPYDLSTSDPCNPSETNFFSYPVVDNSFAVAPDGGIYVVAFDAASGNEAILRISPQNQTSGTFLIADPAWIEGSDVPINQPVALAFDPIANNLWVRDAFPNSSAQTEELFAFNVSSLANQTGPQDLKPVATLGGETPGRFQTVAWSQSTGEFPATNSLAVANGLLFYSNWGFLCDTACQNVEFDASSPGGSGEVDAYNAEITGTHISDTASTPVAIFFGPNVQFPIGVAYGAHGTGLGTQGVRRMHATHYVNPRLFAQRRLRRERLRALFLRMGRRPPSGL